MEALSPTMEEGQLVRWLKAEGDEISSGDILAEIETDKATMELVARGDGVLRKVFLGEGQTSPVGAVIAVIAGQDDDISDIDGVSAAKPADAGAPRQPPPTESEGSTGPGSTGQDAGVRSQKDGVVAGSESSKAKEVIQPVAGEATPGERESTRLRASPLARRLAEDADLDLRAVKGSGPRGRIVMRDVEAAKAGRAQGRSGEEPRVTYRSDRRRADGPDFEDRPLSQMRKAIARRLVESIGPVPHFFLRISVDMSRTLEARSRVNRLLEPGGEKVSVNDFILKATAGALALHPEVNSQWMEDMIRRHFRVHLGVAVAVDDGLITPVIRDADGKGLVEIAREVRELAARGREKRLQPEEYTGSTFSVSNLGMFGIHEFTGVINPPEAGILAVGAVEDTPMASNGGVVVKPVMKVTMSCDHRVVDGATGARFLQTLKEMLEEPAVILI